MARVRAPFRLTLSQADQGIIRSSDTFIRQQGQDWSIELELGKLAEQGQQAVENLNRLNLLMAESRLLELEITESKFAGVFTPEQQRRMRSQIDELRALTNDRNL